MHETNLFTLSIPTMTEQYNTDNWIVVERPGYFGSKKAEREAKWDAIYGFNEKGQRNWRVAWEAATGERLTFDEIFQEYIQGYASYFQKHPDILFYLIYNASYTYDIDPTITKEQAFTPRALVDIPGIANQFHHVAINIAMENVLGIAFQGNKPLQIRGCKKNIPMDAWPLTARLQPGFIPCLHPERIRKPENHIWWIHDDSIEALYQYNKVIEVRQ